MSMLTLGQVRESLPINHRNNITQDMVNQLNALSTKPEEARYMRDNFISFSQVLQDGKFRIGDYVRAVMYVTHKVMGRSNLEAYKQVLPDRYARMINDNYDNKNIASIVTAYNKGLLVTKVMERAMVPTWILNQDMFQKALQTNYDIMTDVTESGRVRVEAANSLLTHLKKPEVHKAELKIDAVASDGMAALEKALVDMSRQQKYQIEHDPGVTANDIAGRTMKTVN